MPAVADGISVRWVEASSPWLSDIGGDPSGAAWEPAIVITADLRYDESKADLLLDQTMSSVLFPLASPVDVTRAAPIVLEPTHLSSTAPAAVSYRLVDVPIGDAKIWKQIERNMIDHLVRSATLDVSVNKELKLYSQPGETPEQFAARCAVAASAAADEDKTKAVAKHADKSAKLQGQRDAAADRAGVVAEQAKERKRGNWVRAASDVLGGIFGSGRQAATRVGRAAERLTRNSDDKRVDEAESRVERIEQQQLELDAALGDETAAIDAKWTAAATAVTTTSVTLERTDVKVRELLLAWVPVP